MPVKKLLRRLGSSAEPTAETTGNESEMLGYETMAMPPTMPLITEPMDTSPPLSDPPVTSEELEAMSAIERARQISNDPPRYEANKYDNNKPPLGLIPRSAQIAEANVLAYGARKYDVHNWRKGMAWSRMVDAALRHLTAWNDGENVDPESGLNHLAHARCCLSFLIEYQEKNLGTDDRHG